MKPQKTRYKGDVWYRLSCLCSVKFVISRRGNGGVCPFCGYRVFILETLYEKSDDPE